MKQKSIHLFPVLVALLLATVPLHAQPTDSKPDGKKRLVFEPGATEPTNPNATPTPTPSPSRLLAPDSPTVPGIRLAASPTPPPPSLYQSKLKDPVDVAVDVFFLALKDENVDVAYDTLVKNTKVGDTPKEVAQLKEKTLQAIDTFGPIDGYEQIDEKKVGGRLVRRTYFSYGEVLPLRWRFYFYRTGDDWKLIDLRVDDALAEFIEPENVPRR